MISKQYKKYKFTRIKLLISAYRHGIKQKDGKTLDPSKYIEKIKTIEKNALKGWPRNEEEYI